MRCLRGFRFLTLLHKPPDQHPSLQVPLHSIIKLSGITRSEEIIVPIEAVDDHELI